MAIKVHESIDQLLSTGWYLYEECRCGGKLTLKYRHEEYPELEIKYYPAEYTFKILRINSLIRRTTPIGRLMSTVTELLESLNES